MPKPGTPSGSWCPGTSNPKAYEYYLRGRGYALYNGKKELQLARNMLEKATRAAEEANKAKSSFLANMSHELRTPMNAIIGYSEMLMEEAEDLDQEDFIPDLRKIHQAGTHLLALINSVLDLAKIESGKMDVFVEEIDVSDMLRGVEGTVPVYQEFVLGGGGLPGRPDDAIGLVTFAGYADTGCPLTLDHDALVGVARTVEIVEDRAEQRNHRRRAHGRSGARRRGGDGLR